MKFRTLIKTFTFFLAITGLIVGASVKAESTVPQLSFTREKKEYPTPVVVHVLINKAVRSNSIKVRITGPSNYDSGDKLIPINASSEEINGSDYLSFKTDKEFSKLDTDTYVATAVVVDANGANKSDPGTASFVVNDGMGQGTTINPKVVTQIKDASGKSINDTSYTYLAPLPGFGESFDISQPGAISNYISILFKLILGVMGVIAVFEIIRFGIQTMSNSFTQKKFAKDRLVNIAMALIIALCSVLLLKTINPKLVDFNLGIQKLDISITVPAFNAAKLSGNVKNISGVYCPGSGGSAEVPKIINSLKNKVTYRFGGTGDPKQPPFNDETHTCDDNGTKKPCKEFCPAGTLCLQCTSFVQYVEKCAGITTKFYGGSAIIFGDTNTQKEKITSISSDGTQVNGKTLRPGDVIGWGTGQNSNEYTGHIVIYKGGGRVADSNGGAPYGKAGTSLGDLPTDFYFNKAGSDRKGIKTQYIIRIP